MNNEVSVSDYIFTWVISQLDCTPSNDGTPDYILNVHYRYKIKYNELEADTYGLVQFGEYQGDEFIPFEELTENNVVSWLEFALDTNELQRVLIKKMEDLLNPPIISLTSPFKNDEGSIIYNNNGV